MRIWMLLVGAVLSAENQGVFPAGVNPIGPYSPGVLTEQHLYISGQGAGDAGGRIPASFEDQLRQTLRNVETVAQTAKVPLGQASYLEIYVKDLSEPQLVGRVLKDFFPEGTPPHVVAQAARMPGDTPVEINAIVPRRAVRSLPGGVREAEERLYLPAAYGAGAMAEMRGMLRAAGSAAERLLLLTVYYTGEAPKGLDRLGVPVALIKVAGLPGGAKWAISGVAAKGKPEGTMKDGCRAFRQTVYCGLTQASGGAAIALQTAQALDRLSERLQKNGRKLEDVVASHVFLGEIGEFMKMNAVYAERFGSVKPSRTTLQPAVLGPEFAIWAIAER